MAVQPCMEWISTGFELVKQNRFAKIFECSKEEDLPREFFLDLQIILWKMQRVLTNLVKFCELNTFFVFLCLIKLQAKTFRITQNLI